jgi:integrative and conjugative element protein (TIGR02256 family)
MPVELRSPDRRFGLLLDEKIVREILSFCAVADGVETGGILLGRYTPDLECAEVTMVTGAPSDSQAGRTWFNRGTAGLQRLVLRLWREKREYYLGEWHYHPGAAPTPSRTDITQMRKIATDPKRACPEPVLVIVGGDPTGDWVLAAGVYLGHRTEPLGEARGRGDSAHGS